METRSELDAVGSRSLTISYGRFRVVWPGLVFARARRESQVDAETDEPSGVRELASLIDLRLLDRLARVLRWRRGAVDAAVLTLIFVGSPLLLWAILAGLDFISPLINASRLFVCLIVFFVPVFAVFGLTWQSRSARQLTAVLKADGCPWCDYAFGGDGCVQETKRCPECGGVRRVLTSGLPEWARERA